MSKKYEISLPNFEGPLDLLLYLIRKHKIDIYDIPIAFILSEYLDYLSLMEKLNISIEGEFMEMAATLIQIKLKTLLPKSINEDEEEMEDPRQELVNNLMAYKKMKESAKILENLSEENSRYFYPSVNKNFMKKVKDAATTYNIDQEEGNVYELIKAIEKHLLKKPQEVAEDVELEKIKVDDKIKELETLFKNKKKCQFSKLIKKSNKPELIAYFLALLELIKRRRLSVHQGEHFSEIYISRK